MVENKNIIRLNQVLSELAQFTDELNDTYQKSISVKYGKKQLIKILDNLKKNTLSKEEWNLINDELHSLFRGYENIFSESDTAVKFDRLINNIYSVSQEITLE